MSSTNDSCDDFQCCPGNLLFCLSMVDFDHCGIRKRKENDNAAEQQQQVKKAHPASENKKAPFSSSSRFNKSCNEAKITKLAKKVVLHTTAWSNNWVCCAFQDWVTQRNELCGEKFSLDLFDKPHSMEIICNCLQQFVLEAWRKDGYRFGIDIIVSERCVKHQNMQMLVKLPLLKSSGALF